MRGDIVQCLDAGLTEEGMCAARDTEQIALPPHDAFGHASRAAGIDEQDIVVAATPMSRHGCGRRVPYDLLIRDNPVTGVRGSVPYGYPAFNFGQPRAYWRQPVDEFAIEDQRFGVRVVQQVQQLLAAVPVVHIERHYSDLERRCNRAEIFRTVEEVRSDLRLPAET